MKTEDEIRAEFEKELTKNATDEARALELKRRPDGAYYKIATSYAWGVWQACQRVNDAEIARLREALDKSNNRFYSILTDPIMNATKLNQIKQRIDANKLLIKKQALEGGSDE